MMKLKIMAIVLFALAALGIEYWIYYNGNLDLQTSADVHDELANQSLQLPSAYL